MIPVPLSPELVADAVPLLNAQVTAFGFSPAAAAWVERAFVEQEIHGRQPAVNESCPRCWLPMAHAPGELLQLTGRPGCACGTARLHDTIEAAVAAHGLSGIERWVSAAVMRARAD